MSVIIGVDPHQATHTPVAIDRDEIVLGRQQVPADRKQVYRLLAGAEPLGCERTWAIESAAGLGRLLAQQLLALVSMSWMCRRLCRRGCGSSVRPRHR